MNVRCTGAQSGVDHPIPRRTGVTRAGVSADHGAHVSDVEIAEQLLGTVEPLTLPSSSSFMALYGRRVWCLTPDGRVSACNDRDDAVSGRSGAERSGVHDTALRGDASGARLTALGSCAMMRRRVAAGPLTRRVPCFHFRYCFGVRSGTFSRGTASWMTS